jgi:hypothetical protein
MFFAAACAEPEISIHKCILMAKPEKFNTQMHLVG